MRIAQADLALTSLDLIHAGEETFPLGDSIRAVSFNRILQDIEPL